MTNHETIKALRDALTEAETSIDYLRSMMRSIRGLDRFPDVAAYAQRAIDKTDAVSESLAALTADASDQTPAKRTTADYSLDSALAQMRGLYALMIEFKVPHARAANSAAHVESAIRHLHRIANATDTARPAPVAAAPAPDSIEHDFEFNRLLEAAYSAEVEQRALDGEFGSAALADKADAALIAYINARIAAAPAAPIAEVTAQDWAARGYVIGATVEKDIGRPWASRAIIHHVHPNGALDVWSDGIPYGWSAHFCKPVAKPEPVVMGVAQDEAAPGKQAAHHHGDAQSNQALISVTGHFGHRQVATPAPRSDAHAKRADVASERDSFEVYWRKVDLSPSLQYQNRFEINCEGNYLYVETRLAWETWQARGQQAGAVDGRGDANRT